MPALEIGIWGLLVNADFVTATCNIQACVRLPCAVFHRNRRDIHLDRVLWLG